MAAACFKTNSVPGAGLSSRRRAGAPRCVLIAGDIYDRQIAPTEAIRLFDSALSRLMSLGTKVCVISGNTTAPAAWPC